MYSIHWAVMVVQLVDCFADREWLVIEVVLLYMLLLLFL